MADAVSRGQRFTAEHPCPICAGYDKVPRGKGLRCFGFIGTDRNYAHCSREEMAGDAPFETRSETYAHRLEGDCRCRKRHGEPPPVTHIDEARQRREGEDRVVTEIHYDYEGGLRVTRRELANGDKTFVQFHRNGVGYLPGRGSAALTLYRAPELRSTPNVAFVFLVEGEKCVEALRLHGLCAVTTSGGSNGWKNSAERATELLRDRHVVILPDHDDPGHKYAEEAKTSLLKVAGSLRVLDLPGLGHHEDVVDWMRKGGEPEDLVRMAEGARDISVHPPRPIRIVNVVEEIMNEAALPVVSTGLLGLDTQLGGGLRARMMHVIVAGSGKGKTSLVVQIAALHAEVMPVLYYSGELTRAQLAARLIGQRTDHSWRDVLRGRVDPAEMRRVLQDLEFDVLRGCPEPIAAIKVAAKEMLARRPGCVPMIVIDYAQIVAEVGTDARLSLMLAIRELASFVEANDVVLIVLSQGSRPSARAMRNGQSNNTEDYVDAGAETSDLEKFASTVIALVYASADGAREHEVTAMIAKQRLGGPCKVGLKFHGASGRWEDLGRTPVTASARKEEERTNQILEMVGRHPRRFTKTELRQAVGGDATPTNKLIDKLVSLGKLVLASAIRQMADGRRRAFQVLDLSAELANDATADSREQTS